MGPLRHQSGQQRQPGAGDHAVAVGDLPGALEHQQLARQGTDNGFGHSHSRLRICSAIAVRAELDALPVVEATGVPWSASGPRMHACGHDVHLAALTALGRAARQADLPLALLAVLQAVERNFGRDRTTERRWGPRTLDLDLIAYDELALRTETLTLPHPRVLERAFVLVPLAEIAPQRKIGGRRVKAALAGVSSAGIERLPALD